MNRENQTHRASTAAVLEFAWDAGIFRADDAIAAQGLTRSTTLTALDTLIDITLVRELPPGDANGGRRMGRPARRFELNADAGVIIGVDAGERRLTAIAADLRGHVLAEEHLALRGYTDADATPFPDADPTERREAVFAGIDAALDLAGKARSDVIAVGVGIPAPVRADGGSPRHPEGFWDYMNAGLLGMLAEQFPAVRLENDASLAAMAESSLGQAQGCANFVAMLVGRRLGAGVFLGGSLARGANGAVGELDPLKAVPEIGGAWGLALLAEQWAHRALAEGRIPAEHPWAQAAEGSLTAERIVTDARLGDPVAAPLLDHLGLSLGRISMVAAGFYDPECIVVCGAMAEALDEVVEIAQRHLDEREGLPAPRIVASTLGGDVVSRGALTAARQAARAVALPLLSSREVSDTRA